MNMDLFVLLVLMFLASTFINITFAGFLAIKTAEFLWERLRGLEADAPKGESERG